MKTNKPLIKWGWLRVLIYLATIAGAGFGAQYLSVPIGQLMKENVEKILVDFATFAAAYCATGIIFIGLTFLFTKFINRQTIMSIGFAIRNYKNESLIGFFTPFFLLGTGSLILIGTGHLSINGIVFKPLLLLLQMLLMMVVAVVEETMFRGYILNNLMQSMNKWIALLLSALLFAFAHLANPDVTWVSFVNILLAGLLLGVNYVYTKNLWYGITFHFAWNFFQGPILGYDVSGYKLPALLTQTVTGSSFFTGAPFGFEGSFVCTVLLLITIIVFYYLFAKRYDATQ